MIIYNYTVKPNSTLSSQSTVGGVAFGIVVPPTTLDDIVAILRSRGFRRELPSRQDIMTMLIQLKAEVVDTRREIERLKLRNNNAR